jgi:alkylation response protein AidB-like acyl-CoA dehydrogenase
MTFNPLERRDDLDAFRGEVRGWLEATVPQNWRTSMQGAQTAQFVAFQTWWLNQLRSVGLATAHWPRDWGGAELSLRHQIIVFEEMAKIDAPELALFVISLYHMPATLFAHGSAEQKARFIVGVRDGADIWCQGFSEPGAGSDLASLRTRAELDGDHYVINGQKIWSSYGPLADYCLLLARTDPAAPKKQGGISVFLLDLKTPGITVRAIKQMNGEAEFAEIFFDNVRVPVSDRVGAENDGWRIAQSTLAAERGLLIFNYAERLMRNFDLDLAEGRDTWMADAGNAREAARFYARLSAVQRMIWRMLAQLEASPHDAGQITTYIKLVWATTLQDYTDFMVRMTGLDGVVQQPMIQGIAHTSRHRMNDFMASYGWTIAGGSNEVIRNVIAERLLGLPKG